MVCVTYKQKFKKVKDFFNVSSLLHLSYDNTKIFELENESINFYFTEVKNIVCISTSKTIIEDAIKSTNSKYNFTNNNDFINIYNTINNSNEVNVIYNLNNLLDLSNNFPNDYSNLMKNINGWVASDMKLRNDKIILNGYNLIDYKLSNYSDILNNQDQPVASVSVTRAALDIDDEPIDGEQEESEESSEDSAESPDGSQDKSSEEESKD